MTNRTVPMQPIHDSNKAHAILMYVYDALREKGYDPVTQLVGYMISGDPTYITSYQGARSLICQLERDEIMDELVHYYIAGHTQQPQG